MIDASAARIIVVDDHPMMRRGVSELVADEPDLIVCGEAGVASRALRLCSQQQPDLVMIDISLPGQSGLTLIRRLRRRDPSAKILVLSMHDELLYFERAFEAGARGYVHKNDSATELLDAIRRVLEGRIYISERLSARMLTRMEHQGAKSGLGSLSARELEVFDLIGQGFRRREIATALGLSTKTVDRYCENIKAKLALKSGAELIRLAISRAEPV